MYLVDTNIFLEILLKRSKSNECKRFLNNSSVTFYISDFSLHSLGVILFREQKEYLFLKIIKDILPQFRLVTLPIIDYQNIPNIRSKLGLDFDDAYQYSVAKYYSLQIVTMDADYQVIKDIKVVFI